jgi:hypothetical protein
MHWLEGCDKLCVEDGRVSRTGNSWAFLAFRRHRAVAPLLDGVNLGYSDVEAEHALVIDREMGRASVPSVAEARQLLHDQWPPQPPMSPEQAAELQARIDELVAKGWREEPVDMVRVQQAMAEQNARVKRMISWLDQCPEPPEQGRGPT